MATALETLKAEQQRLADAVTDAENVLEQRRAALLAFRKEAMASLGLSKTGPGNLAARRAAVRPLYMAGETASAAATRLSLPLAVVEKDFAYFSKRQAPANPDAEDDDVGEGADSGHSAQLPTETSREAVQRLALQGKDADAISKLLDMSRASVGQHLAFLRAKGRIPPAKLAAPASTGDEPPFAAGSTVEQIKAEIDKQCRASGNRVGPVVVMTTLGGDKKHAHRCKINRMGDGRTDVDGSGHYHLIDHYAVGLALGHRHAIQVQE